MSSLPIHPPHNGNFDLRPFLDPQVDAALPISQIIEPHSNSNPTVTRDQSSSESRQLSLRPTTAFITRRTFNTSCAFTIPLFIFSLPLAAAPDSPTHTSNQMVYSLFGVLYTVASFVVPVVFTGIRDPTITGRSQVGNTGAILNRLMAPQPMIDFMGTGTKHRIGLDTTQCLLKSICDANRDEDENNYGLLALPFQIFYPPPSKDASNETISALQIAARIGKYEDAQCGKVYPCLIDMLDLGAFVTQWMFPENNNSLTSDFKIQS